MCFLEQQFRILGVGSGDFLCAISISKFSKCSDFFYYAFKIGVYRSVSPLYLDLSFNMRNALVYGDIGDPPNSVSVLKVAVPPECEQSLSTL